MLFPTNSTNNNQTQESELTPEQLQAFEQRAQTIMALQQHVRDTRGRFGVDAAIAAQEAPLTVDMNEFLQIVQDNKRNSASITAETTTY